jgi:hypothetical protein
LGVNGHGYFESDLGYLEALIIIPMILHVPYNAGYFLTSSAVRSPKRRLHDF